MSYNQMAAFHGSRRRGDGRVMHLNREATTGLRRRDLRGLDVGIVTKADYNRFKRFMKTYVGFLAAGLNVAAAKLGSSLPQWIKRHGTPFGSISIKATVSGITIRILQNVPFVDAVRGDAAKWNWALAKEAKGLVSQASVIAKRGARQLDLKLK